MNNVKEMRQLVEKFSQVEKLNEKLEDSMLNMNVDDTKELVFEISAEEANLRMYLEQAYLTMYKDPLTNSTVGPSIVDVSEVQTKDNGWFEENLSQMSKKSREYFAALKAKGISGNRRKLVDELLSGHENDQYISKAMMIKASDTKVLYEILPELEKNHFLEIESLPREGAGRPTMQYKLTDNGYNFLLEATDSPS